LNLSDARLKEELERTDFMTIEKALVLFCRVAVITLIGIASLTGASAPFQELVVRCSAEELRQLQTRHGAAIIDAIPASGSYLIALPAPIHPAEIKAANSAILTSQNFELGIDESFPRPSAADRFQWDLVPFHTSNVPRFYLDQPSATNIEVLRAHRLSTGKRSVVALIDTGIDDTHPVLKNIVVRGKNYVTQGAPSEWNDPRVDQSQSTVFDLQSQSTVFDLTPVFSVLRGNINVLFAGSADSSFRAMPLPAAFGHGTMTAGIIHLVAPDAELMPMKAFDADGKASLWNLIRAVRDSVDMGADVINMSFSAPEDEETALLFKTLAVDYAKASNVALVAGAGNQNRDIEVLPAAIDPVNAIAAVDNHDVKASFSNYGDYISFSAPGTDVITTYPGTFAMASGTSFSAPFVSGIYALLREAGSDGRSGRVQIERGSDSIGELNDPSIKHKLGKGRINAFKTMSIAVLRPLDESGEASGSNFRAQKTVRPN
jgi:subtilisin family serine protease